MYPPSEPELMLRWVTRVLTENGYTVVAEKDGRIVGSLGLGPYQFPWSARWYANFEWFYVDHSFREGGTADALLVAAHAWADEKDAPIVGGVSSAKQATIKDRLMRMKGYVYIGGQFVREPHGQLVRGRTEANPNLQTAKLG